MTLAVRAAPPATLLDYGLLRRASLAFGIAMLVVAPASPDPLAIGAGGFVPWLVLRVLGLPRLPAAVAFYLLWQWVQIFTRPLLSIVDGVAMGRSMYGPEVADAYWYMLASVVTLAAAFRIVLGGTRAPGERARIAHLAWRPLDLFMVYLGAFAFSVAAGYLIGWFPSLWQQINAVSQFKIVALFLLFATVLATRQGTPFLLTALALETVVGFTGLLSDFKAAYIFLALAALAVRIRWSGMASALSTLVTIALLAMALFWTSVKTDYREIITGSSDTQALQIPFQERLGYMLKRVRAVDDIDWADAGYKFLMRLAYVDVFGSVIGVDTVAREAGPPMRQWSDAAAHVFQPRFLFPDKAELSDLDVYLRLTHADASEAIRGNTSVSVGYMAENYVDLGFPGMLAGVFVVGLLIAGVTRYFMSRPLPWMVREGTALAFIYTACGTGVEMSLPKIIGTTLMFLVCYAVLMKFAYPMGLRWLDAQAMRMKAQVRAKPRTAANRPTRS